MTGSFDCIMLAEDDIEETMTYPDLLERAVEYFESVEVTL